MKNRSLRSAACTLALSTAGGVGIAPPHTEYAAVIRKHGSAAVLGVATMEASPGNRATSIMVQFKGEKPGTVHHWRVHYGSCAVPGKILGDSAAFLPVTADAKGLSKRKIEIAQRLPDSGEFHIRILESARKAAKSFACVDFYLED
ncbi:MAG: hypothetical protein ABI120_25800 [Gemmatimonadaceae bacterium]